MKMKKTFKFPIIYSVGPILLFMFCGCTKDLAAKKVIRINGSSTMIPVATKAAEQFMRKHPHIEITVSPGGSGVGVKSIGNGFVDIGMVSRDITEDEKNSFSNIDFKTYLIGRDAVACVVSSEIYESGVHELSKEQMRDIYSGKVNNWAAFGSPDKEILCIDKEPHRGARQVFMEYIFGDKDAEAKGADIVVGNNNETQAKVALSDQAIAMVSFAWINVDVKGLAVKVGERSIQPSVENLKNGSYPISRDLFFVTNGAATGIVKDYIDFVLSREGQKIIEENGFVPSQ